jgi:hypothetical protein
MRKPISVTLEADNVLWLRAQAAATSRGSVSDVLDRIVTDARQAGRGDPSAIRSVVGTIDLPDDDPDLAEADAYVKALFAASARRPMMVKERSASKTTRKGRRG